MLHFCTVDDVKTLTPAGPRYDTLIDDVRQSVTASFTDYINRSLDYAENVIETFDMLTTEPRQVFRLYLERRLIDPASLMVTYADRLGFGNVFSGVAPPPLLDAAAGKLTFYGPSRFRPGGITVTYSGGYPARLAPGVTIPQSESDILDAMACPVELKLAAMRQSAKIIQTSLNQNDGTKEEQKGRATLTKVTTVNGLIPEVANALNPYRRSFSRVI